MNKNNVRERTIKNEVNTSFTYLCCNSNITCFCVEFCLLVFMLSIIGFIIGGSLSFAFLIVFVSDAN